MTKTLVVQRGHVARTSGATGAPGEQQMARRVAAAIAEIVGRVDGWSVRVIDADEPTSRYAGDAFISVHGDGNGNPSVSGASVGYRNGEGRRLAEAWKSAYVEAGWSRGFRADNYTTNLSRYYGTGRAVSAGNPVAAIIEVGFMTNPGDRAFIDSAEGVRAAAVAAVSAATGVRVATLLGGAAPSLPGDEGPAPTPAPDRPRSAQVLTVGDQGADVRSWQLDLIAYLGADALPRFGADGDFGAETRAATVAAMRRLRLISGSADPRRPLVGPGTRAAMADALRSGRTTFSFRHTEVIRRGSSGAAVREWQEAVRRLLPGALPRFGADGDFGAETSRDTARAMVALGLVGSAPANPVVGPRTRRAMAARLSRRG